MNHVFNAETKSTGRRKFRKPESIPSHSIIVLVQLFRKEAWSAKLTPSLLVARSTVLCSDCIEGGYAVAFSFLTSSIPQNYNTLVSGEPIFPQAKNWPRLFANKVPDLPTIVHFVNSFALRRTLLSISKTASNYPAREALYIPFLTIANPKRLRQNDPGEYSRNFELSGGDPGLLASLFELKQVDKRLLLLWLFEQGILG